MIDDPWITDFLKAQDKWNRTLRHFRFRQEPGRVLAINGGVAFMQLRDPQTGKYYTEHVPVHELKGIDDV